MSTASKKLFTNTLIYTIGNFSAKILVFLLLPFFSFYLTKSELGMYDVVLTIVNFFVPIVSLQLSEAVYRWLLTSYNNFRYQKIIISSGLLVTLLSLVVFEIAYYIFNLYSANEYYLYTIFLIVTSSLVPFFQNIVRGLQKTKLYAGASIFQAVFLLAINIFCLVVLKLKLEAVFLANILANILTMLYLYIGGRLYRYINFFNVSRSEIKNLLKYSLPLIPNSISWWLVNAASKLIILYYLSTEFNGIYAVSSRFPTIIILFNSIFILAWQDHTILTKQGDAEESSFNSKVFDQYVNFEMSITLILISSSELFIRYLVSSDFYEAYKFMPFLYLGAAFSAFSGYLGAAYLKEKKTIGVFISSSLAGLLNVLITIFLIRYIGLYAPVLAAFVSFVAMFIYRAKDTRSFFLIKINYLKLTLLAVLSLFFSFIIIFYNISTLNYMLILVSFVVGIVLNIRVIMNLKSILISKFSYRNSR